MWWIRKTNLPLSEGPYVPGCADVMTQFSLDGCFVRLYYPTSLSCNLKDGWFPWLPHDKYMEGFAFVIRIWLFLVKLVFALYTGKTYIPAAWEAPLRTKGERVPVVVFSHGLGASRFFYSMTCTELASHGFLVAAVEHRDESACVSYYYKSTKDRYDDNPTWIHHKRVNLGPNHFPVRETQVKHRVTECQQIVDLLEKLDAGLPVENMLKSNFQLAQLKDRLNMSNLTMMGHSFGAATALMTMGIEPRFKFGVILDAWMYPLKEEKHLPGKISQPLLFINTQTFHIPSNLETMRKFTDIKPQSDGKRDVFTIKKTTHENQSDTPHMVGYWLNWRMKKLDPVIATRINHDLILDFLQKHIGLPHGQTVNTVLHSQSHNYVKGLTIGH